MEEKIRTGQLLDISGSLKPVYDKIIQKGQNRGLFKEGKIFKEY